MKESYRKAEQETIKEIEFLMKMLDEEPSMLKYWNEQIAYYQGRLEVIRETLDWLE
jgi:hypothetical protein